jgi:hypothetical protein
VEVVNIADRLLEDFSLKNDYEDELMENLSSAANDWRFGLRFSILPARGGHAKRRRRSTYFPRQMVSTAAIFLSSGLRKAREHLNSARIPLNELFEASRGLATGGMVISRPHILTTSVLPPQLLFR